MRTCLNALILLLSALLASCATIPTEWPESSVELDPIDNTSITVKEGFKFSPSLTSFLLPPGEYIPIMKDERGTYYAAPSKIMISTAGGSYFAEGGILRKSNESANYGMSIFYNQPPFGKSYRDLHSLLGLDLNKIIECDPPHEFK